MLTAVRDQTRAREPNRAGHVDVDGVHIGYEVFGTREPTLLLLPTWTIIHSRFWKPQVPYLARRFRVVTFDGAGNGRSDRTTDPAAYTVEADCEAALSVLDATGTEQAVLVSLSQGGSRALWLSAHQPERVLGSVYVGPSVGLAPQHRERAAAFAVWSEPYASTEGWAKHNRYYWLDHYEDFARFFFGRCFTEPHSTKQTEDCVGWALQTTPEVLIADRQSEAPDAEALRAWCARVRCPSLVVHGEDDEIAPIGAATALADGIGATLVRLEGSGHIPLARDPVRVNLLIREFVESLR